MADVVRKLASSKAAVKALANAVAASEQDRVALQEVRICFSMRLSLILTCHIHRRDFVREKKYQTSRRLMPNCSKKMRLWFAKTPTCFPICRVDLSTATRYLLGGRGRTVGGRKNRSTLRRLRHCAPRSSAKTQRYRLPCTKKRSQRAGRKRML